MKQPDTLKLDRKSINAVLNQLPVQTPRLSILIHTTTTDRGLLVWTAGAAVNGEKTMGQ